MCVTSSVAKSLLRSGRAVRSTAHGNRGLCSAFMQERAQSGGSFWAIAAAVAVSSVGVAYNEEYNAIHGNVYRLDEIGLHKTKENGIWVTFEGGVYDITKFVVNHPGGADKVMLAAGSDIGPFWNLYPQHTKSSMPKDLLTPMRIGTLHPEDRKSQLAEAVHNPADPYSSEPPGSPLLEYHMKKPSNAECPNSLLTENWITPADLFFVRNHHPSPLIENKDYLLTISGLGLPHGHMDQLDKDKAITFTLKDLKTKFNKVSIVNSVQCGGNRRAEMNSIRKTFGSPWKTAAISTAKWSGVRLSDLLKAVGVSERSAEKDGIKHIQFNGGEGLDASIPAHKGLSAYGDVIIAYEMNDKPIPVQHGAPVRIIVPGYVGVRNVKWLKRIVLSSEECYGPWQRGMSYKGFGPSTVNLEGIDVEKIPSLQEQPVNSAISIPQKGTKLEPGCKHTVKGYAYSGGGRGIIRVDVSADGGETWQTADLKEGADQPLHKAWAWTLWETEVEIPEAMEGKECQIICKATDAAYNCQPDNLKGIWNLRGINNNSWHRVDVKAEAQEDEEEGEE